MLPVVGSKNQLVVAIYLWRRQIVCGDRKTFDVPNGELKSLGISRETKYQTLVLLEAAGVIRIKRSGKKALTVIDSFQGATQEETTMSNDPIF